MIWKAKCLWRSLNALKCLCEKFMSALSISVELSHHFAIWKTRHPQLLWALYWVAKKKKKTRLEGCLIWPWISTGNGLKCYHVNLVSVFDSLFCSHVISKVVQRVCKTFQLLTSHQLNKSCPWWNVWQTSQMAECQNEGNVHAQRDAILSIPGVRMSNM